ncbi:GAF domain-containing protein [Chondrinema litorale]|uniref:GAF domain-containing protein n=1 Tax=Chondrinema litorale TaxID=2994555 RepID=UPI0025437030|nr:GAF domain-containing protein [Chondrinema litorale]UZR99140.1 GAF domain-containing protein [Chondrinema litorale]
MKNVFLNLPLKKKFLILTSVYVATFIIGIIVIFTSQAILNGKAEKMALLNKYKSDLPNLRVSVNALRGELFVALLADKHTMIEEVEESQAGYEFHRAKIDNLKASLVDIQNVIQDSKLNSNSEVLYGTIDSLCNFTDFYIKLALNANSNAQDSIFNLVRAKVLKEYVPMFIEFRQAVTDSYDYAFELHDIVLADYDETETFRNTLLVLFFICGIILVFTFSQYLSKLITEPILKTKDTLEVISKGEIPEIEINNQKDETGAMLGSLKTLVNNLDNLKIFTTEVGKGKFNSQVSLFGNRGDIAESLLAMRENLQQSSIKEEEFKWISSGIAEAGKLLREQYENVTTLYDSAIRYVVKYLAANQGSLFVTLDDNELDQSKELELVACYAFDRKKYITQTIHFGEGLVGQVCLEKELIYLTEIPKNYLKITSGLGEAAANSIIIIPLINNEKVQGVLEIASFSKLTNKEIEFLKQFCDLLAADIAMAKFSSRMQRLLEVSKQQTEELRATEEELRQNMEELNAAQEQLQREAKYKEENMI